MKLQDGKATFHLWLDAVEAGTGWCQAHIPLSLTGEELLRLSEGLRKLSQDGHGSYLWANDGGEVRIETVMAKRGETHISVRLQSPPDFLHELNLVFVGRQEDLPALIESI